MKEERIGPHRLILGDCLEVMRAMPGASVDSIVTDPPYGLSFMGKRWDYDVPSVDVWAECLRVLRPGGYLLAFAGTRTQHRMAVRIEDAGFEIRDMIAWVYGSGFPKSHNLSGDYQGWGTALKPALEPITVARKPFAGTVAANVREHGTGALNIDGCRVAANGEKLGGGMVSMGRPKVSDGWDRPWMHDPEITEKKKQESAVKVAAAEAMGRWPANLIHDGSDEVLAGFPDSKGQQGAVRGTESSKTGDANCYGEFGRVPFAARGDTGSAARFFYCAKASKTDRDEGLDAFSETPFVQFQTANGTSGKPSSLSEGRDTSYRNTHPTVKPTDLMRYLCRLVTPIGGVVLDPFMGSGSTGKAARREGFSFVGIERESDYFRIASARVSDARAMLAAEQPDLFIAPAPDKPVQENLL